LQDAINEGGETVKSDGTRGNVVELVKEEGG